MTSMTFDIISWEARLLLEACRVLEQQWAHVAKTTEDEDEQADYSNDLCQLDIVKERLEKAALEAFGPGITKGLHS